MEEKLNLSFCSYCQSCGFPLPLLPFNVESLFIKCPNCQTNNEGDIIINSETIQAISTIVENAFKEAGKEDELKMLCDFALQLPPPKLPPL